MHVVGRSTRQLRKRALAEAKTKKNGSGDLGAPAEDGIILVPVSSSPTVASNGGHHRSQSLSTPGPGGMMSVHHGQSMDYQHQQQHNSQPSLSLAAPTPMPMSMTLGSPMSLSYLPSSSVSSLGRAAGHRTLAPPISMGMDTGIPSSPLDRR